MLTNSITDNNRDTGYKLFAGYQFNRFFAAEGGYFDLGKFGYNADTTPTGTVNGNIRLRGVNLDGIGFLPITDKFSAYGRLGMDYAQARDSFSGTGAVLITDPNPSQRALNAHAGLGLQYNMSNELSLRAEAERYRVSDAVGNRGDIDLVSLSLIYRFGAKSPAPAPAVALAEPAPPSVAPAPAAAPPPPPVVTPPKPTRVSFAADSLFDFDKSTVKPRARPHLTAFLPIYAACNTTTSPLPDTRTALARKRITSDYRRAVQKPSRNIWSHPLAFKLTRSTPLA